MSARLQPSPHVALAYRCDTPWGALRLALPCPTHVAPAPVAAVRLGACDSLLQQLHRWWAPALATSPEWHWIEGSDGTADGPADYVTLDWRSGDGVSAEVSAPVRLLLAAGPPPGALASQIRWAEVPVWCVLDRFELDADEAAALEPGGAVLLPGSFVTGARQALRTVHEPLQVQSPMRAWPAGPDAGGDPVLPAGRWVVQQQAPAVPWPCAAGWQAGGIDRPGCGPGELWQAGADGAFARRAHGTVVPWGHGLALLLGEVYPLPS